MKTRGRAGSLLLLRIAMVAGCSDGGGGTTSTPGPPPFPASATLADKCAPGNPYAAASMKSGSLDAERRWVRSYFDEAYLWYNEIPAVDTLQLTYNLADIYTSMKNYFMDLRTPALTVGGKAKDRFSFIYPSADWNSLAQDAQAAGFGAEWFILSSAIPRDVRVAYVEPNTPAAAAGVIRGMKVVSINGASIDADTQSEVDLLNEALVGPIANTNYTFVLQTPVGAFIIRAMTAQLVNKTPVLQTLVLPVSGGKVGYIVFNDHLLPAEGQLIAAFTQLSQQNISELVLDLRYNGGGYLYIASQVGYMIAGAATQGKTFEKLIFNNKRISDNASTDSTTPFYNIASGLASSGTVSSTTLPQLGLNRVFIIAGPGTCSASESLINGLRGIDVQVVLVGGTTCGKPFGFTAKDNCGISYFPIEFSGVNAKGFGDYADGFAANCPVADDFDHALGDPAELRLSAALNYITTGQCPATRFAPQVGTGGTGGQVARHAVRESKWR